MIAVPKGVYDRAASAWVPPPRAEYPPELVTKVRELYEAGHTMREVADLTGTTVKVLQRLMPRHGITRRPAVPRDQRGERNATWRGPEAKYQALHLRVQAVRGKPSRCSACDTTEGRFEWANLTGRYENISDFIRLCKPCHVRFDAARRAATGRRTMPAPGGGGDV